MIADEQVLAQRYRLEAFVARGAWGAVHRGVDLETGAPVAIKRLHEHLFDATYAERFEREARMLASLESPFVVRYLAHGRDAGDRPFIVTEWLDGVDLACWKKSRPLAQREVFEAVRQAALGLAALHEGGIVHRDVKPSNFFVLERPSGIGIKLIDLGVARAVADATLTALGFTLGTPAYMSPEQARSEPRLTARSDLFSLGVMLFELCAGKKPYRADDMLSLVMKIVLQEPPRLREVLPQIAPAIDELVARAMARAPEARFSSAREMAEALAGLLASDEISSARDGSAVSDETLRDRIIVVSDTGLTPISRGPPSSVFGILEQRVITAVFASFGGAGEPESAVEGFRLTMERHGGAFHRVLGAHRVAVFGASIGRGDEVMRAARAALQASAIEGIRLAIVTGRAVAGEGTLSGSAIERGMREVKRSRGEVRVDEPTARLLDGRFQIEGATGDRVLPKAEAPPDAFGPRLLGQATPMLGRDRESAALLAIFEQCVSEPVARAVLLIGPAGAGKSRLRYELLRRLAAEPSPPAVLVCRGDSLGAGSAFGMIAPAIRRLAGILDGEPLEESRKKLVARLARVLSGPSLARTAAFVGELARVPFPDDHGAALRAARQSPMVMNDAMRAAWEDWIAAECEAHPVVLVLEDLHWGDLPSVKFADAALRNLRDRPFMVLALARPEVHGQFPGLFAGRDLEEMRLGALTKKASEKLARHVLGGGASDDVVRRIVDRADGNAFYLEELIRAAAERSSDELPETVLGMVQARLDALGPHAKRLLRAASLFGRTFWRGGVRALVGGDEGAHVAQMLDQLVACEVVVERPSARLPGEIEYAFTHALVREAAYALLTDQGKIAGHHLAGEWLEARGYADAMVLAEHFARADDPDRARAWYRRAAEQALEGNDLGAALDRADRGIEAAAAGEELCRLRLIQAEAHRWRGELALAEERASQAIDELALGSALGLRAAAELATSAALLGHTDRLEALGREVISASPPKALASAHVEALCRAAIPLFWAGRASAGALFSQIDALADPPEGLSLIARALVHFSLATRALYGGAPSVHLAEQEAAYLAFAEGGDARNAASRQVAVGFANAELGRYAEAEAALRAAHASCERMGLHNISARALCNLGNVLCREGALDEARAVTERAIEACVAQGDPRLEGMSRTYLAQILARAGDVEGAAREARTGAKLAASAPATRALALGTLARALLAAGRAPDALSASADAMATFESLGRLDEGESLVRLTFAEALRANGDDVRAREILAAARGRVMERALTIEDPDLRRSFLSAIAENAETLRLTPPPSDEPMPSTAACPP